MCFSVLLLCFASLLCFFALFFCVASLRCFFALLLSFASLLLWKSSFSCATALGLRPSSCRMLTGIGGSGGRSFPENVPLGTAHVWASCLVCCCFSVGPIPGERAKPVGHQDEYGLSKLNPLAWRGLACGDVLERPRLSGKGFPMHRLCQLADAT